MADLHAYDPFGVNRLKDADRQLITQAYQGDALSLMIPNVTFNGEPATPLNCRVHFTLKNDRFDSNTPEATPFGIPVPTPTPGDEYDDVPKATGLIWLGTWHDGVAVTATPGLLQVDLPQWAMDLLRRGSYIYTVDVATPLGERRQTVTEGTIQIEYGANAPNPNVSYRTADYNFILGRIS